MTTRAFRSLAAIISGAVLAAAAGWASARTLYRITDLGTLGAPSIVATAMNDAGQVTGSINFSDLEPHAFLWDGAELKDLGTMGRFASIGLDINSSGQVVGLAADADFDEFDAFRWDGSTMENLGTLGGWVTRARAINASGQATGSSNLSSPTGAFQPHAFLSTGSTMEDLGTLGGRRSEGYAINASGQVTGRASLADELIVHAILWDGTQMRDLGTLGGPQSHGSAINDAGQVAGQADLPGDRDAHAFLWDGATMQDLGTLGGTDSSASDINTTGQVTGSSTLEDSSTHAFLWDGTRMRDLGALGGRYSQAAAINASGQVTGYAELPVTRAYRAILSNGGPMVDLNDLVDPTDPLKRHVTLQTGVDINRRGQIAANGYDSRDATFHAYLVSPMQYRIRYLAPAANSTWTHGAAVPVKVTLIGVDGKRIDDSRATALVGACKMKFSASCAQHRTTACMQYDASANEFYFDWHVDTTGSQPVRLKVAATYRFNMPETITTTKSRTVAIIQ